MTLMDTGDPRTPIDLAAGVRGGAAGGLAFLILEMALVPLVLGGSAWGPVRMIAGLVMGPDVVPPAATVDGVVVVGLAVHFALSALYGVILALIVPRMMGGQAVLIGGLYGLVLYLVNFYGFTLLFPWFAMAHNWVTVLSHLAFGVVAGAVYVDRVQRVTPVRAV